MSLTFKSEERIHDLGEVFTPEKIVKDMCNLVPMDVWNKVDSTFLEPACGNGNFMVEILNRKIDICKNEDDFVLALQSIYGIDIMPDNVAECKERLAKIMQERTPVKIELVNEILEQNIICGDSLKMKTIKGNWIRFKDWKTGKFESLKNMATSQADLFATI